jgi:hypothetical protein
MEYKGRKIQKSKDDFKGMPNNPVSQEKNILTLFIVYPVSDL